ncbi:hypothetical protein [Pantanalinema sp. GBBB05]|uniref:hypothetical protein n=1 Tax=Pantanalinema sp. GBBB05 TaxID=2604139 RepID=UPI001E022ED3|nr:hypothetical protein [Pantanalinema sp. GBBB05]
MIDTIVNCIEMKLQDSEGSGLPLNVMIKATASGIDISFNGYSTATENNPGTPIFIENRNGVPHVLLWDDINKEDPSHVISLEGASIHLRVEPD